MPKKNTYPEELYQAGFRISDGHREFLDRVDQKLEAGGRQGALLRLLDSLRRLEYNHPQSFDALIQS